jgi:hypothetical protein
MRKTKQKQKQKQSQSTNINIKIGDTRKRRGTKRRAQKTDDAKPNVPPRVITQFVGQGVPLQSQLNYTSTLNDYVKKTDFQALQDQLFSSYKNSLQPQTLLPQSVSSTPFFTRPDPEPINEASSSSSSSSSSTTPFGPVLPDLKFGGGQIEQPDLSSLLPAQDFPNFGKNEANDEKEPEQEDDIEVLPPGESISVGSAPSLIMDALSVKSPLYDTGLDFHYKLNKQPVTERIYLNIKGTAFFYNGQNFVNVKSVLSKAPKALLNTLLRDKQIVYDVDEKNKVYWIDVAKNA